MGAATVYFLRTGAPGRVGWVVGSLVGLLAVLVQNWLPVILVFLRYGGSPSRDWWLFGIPFTVAVSGVMGLIGWLVARLVHAFVPDPHRSASPPTQGCMVGGCVGGLLCALLGLLALCVPTTISGLIGVAFPRQGPPAGHSWGPFAGEGWLLLFAASFLYAPTAIVVGLVVGVLVASRIRV